MYDARQIANEILLRAWDEDVRPTQLDLQKITYFLHGHHLIDHRTPLIATPFEALHHGPVQRVLLDVFRKWGDEPIAELAMRFDPVRRTYHDLPRVMDNAAVSTIEKYLDRYLETPTFAMVDLTHRPGTPWSETMRQARNVVNMGMRISDDLILSRFEGLTSA
jgi:uncharacterized phage-associated protein